MSLQHLQAVLEAKGFQLTRLTEDHFLDSFETHDSDRLGNWLRKQAPRLQEEDLAVVWVVCQIGSTEPVAYFTLSTHQVNHKDSITKKDRVYAVDNSNIAATLPAHPALLLGKFARDKEAAPKGFGAVLMLCVYAIYLESGAFAASRYLVLDAGNESLAKYYQEGFGFKRNSNTLRLYMTTADVRANFSEAISQYSHPPCTSD